MTPITPHLAEELWYKSKKEGFVSNESYPRFKPDEIFEKEEVGEYLISKVVDDISEILKVTSIKPKKIYVYTTPKWKQDIFRQSIELAEKNQFNIKDIMKQILSKPGMKVIAKEVSQFVGKLSSEVMKLNDEDKERYLVDLNEYDYLTDAKGYLENMFSCKVEVFKADDRNKEDPINKARFAAPLRPAIYIVK